MNNVTFGDESFGHCMREIYICIYMYIYIYIYVYIQGTCTFDDESFGYYMRERVSVRARVRVVWVLTI